MNDPMTFIVCSATSRSTGRRCKQPAVSGKKVCRYHGGKSLGGAASPSLKSGRYSKYMPERLLEHYREAIDNPELLELRSEISLIEARIADLLTRVDTGEAGKLWADARKANDRILKELNNENYGGVILACQDMDRCIGSALADFEAWAQIGGFIEQRRKLTESEQKRLVAMQQMVTSEQALLFAARILSIIKEHVTDRHILTKIQSSVTELLTK